MQTSIGVIKYGMTPSQPAGADLSAAANGAVGTGNSHVAQVGVDNPMLWLLGIGALTIGLIGINANVHFGRAHASASVG